MHHYVLLMFCLLLTVSCSTSKTPATPAGTAPSTTSAAPAAAPAASYAGDWEVTVKNTPGGTVTGTMTLTETAEGLAGSFKVGDQETELRSVSATEDGLRLSFYSAEYQTDVDMRLKGAPDADTLEGSTLSQFPTTATRK